MRHTGRAMVDTHEIYRTMDLALRIGEVLLATGAGAADVSAQMNNVGRACGLRNFAADVTFTELTMSYQPPGDEPALIQIRQVRARQVNYTALTAVDRLVRDLVAGRTSRDDAAATIRSLTSAPNRRPAWTITASLGVMGAAVALMLEGTWPVLLIAFAAACCIDIIARQLARRRVPVFYQQAAGGLFATLLAAGVTATISDIGPSRVITSSIFILLAGVSFLGAVQDALTGFPLTSAARFLEAVMATVGVLGGVSGGLTLASVAGIGLGDIDPGTITLAPWPATTAGATVAAAAYAYSAQAPIRSLLPSAAIAAAGTGLYLAVSGVGISVTWSSALGAGLIGVVSYSVAGRCRVPPLLIVTAAIVPLLPGLSAYRALALFSQGSNGALFALANAAAITVALGAGVIGGEYVAQPLKREARRLETKLSGPRLVGPLTVRHERRRPRRRATSRNRRN